MTGSRKDQKQRPQNALFFGRHECIVSYLPAAKERKINSGIELKGRLEKLTSHELPVDIRLTFYLIHCDFELIFLPLLLFDNICRA